MLLSIAWKNVWRNKLRSLVVIIAVMLGILAGSFTMGLINGVTQERTRSVIKQDVSHIQIHNKKYLENNEINYTLQNAQAIHTFVSDKIPEAKGISNRLRVNGMATDGSHNAGINLIGINPEDEKSVSEIHTALIDSFPKYLSEEHQNAAVIGEALAKKLYFDRYTLSDSALAKLKAAGFDNEIINKIKPLKNIVFRRKGNFNDTLEHILGKENFEKHEYFIRKYSLGFKNRIRLRIDFSRKDGTQTSAVFKVTGIFKINNTGFEQRNIFIKKEKLAELAGFKESDAHEIAVLLEQKEQAKAVAGKISEKFGKPKIRTWGEINPELKMLSEYMDIYNYMMLALILFALAFGIINTMLMAIMERTKELGMLAAVGMNRKRIFSMIMLETVFLTLTGAVAGMILNVLLMMRLEKTGIDLSKQIGEGFEAMGYSAVMYPKMEPHFYIGITLLVIFTALISSIYPALKALKLKPAEAVRADV